jgi:hypothetical protein
MKFDKDQFVFHTKYELEWTDTDQNCSPKKYTSNIN